MGYPNGSNGAALPGHACMFLGARSDCRLSLLNSLCTRRGMPLTDRLERRGGLFHDSTSTLFFIGVRFESGELLEDNSSFTTASLSSGRIGSLPLFCLTGGAEWLLPRAFSIYSPSRRAAGGRFPIVDVDTTLQLGHLSSLFLLLRLHILALVKELVFQGLID